MEKEQTLYLKMQMLKQLNEVLLDALEIQDNHVMPLLECWLKNQSMQKRLKDLENMQMNLKWMIQTKMENILVQLFQKLNLIRFKV